MKTTSKNEDDLINDDDFKNDLKMNMDLINEDNLKKEDCTLPELTQP